MSGYVELNVSSEAMNSTAKNYANLERIYNKVELFSAYIMVVLSPVTVITNGMFLLALYRNTRIFRKTPTIAFIVGLSLADFFTGLLVEPAFAAHYMLKYYQPNSIELKTTKLIYIIGGTISTVAISTSYVTVLAMSLSQYIAIRYPHSYKSIITTKRVIRLLILSGIYFLAFSLIPYAGISQSKFLLVDVILHPTLISCCLIVIHVLIRQAFKKHVAKPARTRMDTFQLRERPGAFSPSTTHTTRGGTPKLPKANFVIVSDSSGLCGKTKKSKDTLVDNDESQESSQKQTLKLVNKSMKSEDYEMDAAKTSATNDIEVKPNEFYSSLRRKRPLIEKQFAVMSFYLSAILLVTSISHTVAFYIFLLRKPKSFSENVSIHIALRVTDVMLFVKVCLDAFIFAWRLPGFKTILKTAGALWTPQKI